MMYVCSHIRSTLLRIWEKFGLKLRPMLISPFNTALMARIAKGFQQCTSERTGSSNLPDVRAWSLMQKVKTKTRWCMCMSALTGIQCVRLALISWTTRSASTYLSVFGNSRDSFILVDATSLDLAATQVPVKIEQYYIRPGCSKVVVLENLCFRNRWRECGEVEVEGNIQTSKQEHVRQAVCHAHWEPSPTGWEPNSQQQTSSDLRLQVSAWAYGKKALKDLPETMQMFLTHTVTPCTECEPGHGLKEVYLEKLLSYLSSEQGVSSTDLDLVRKIATQKIQRHPVLHGATSTCHSCLNVFIFVT